MRKILVLIFLFPLFSFSQEAITTIEEYNFLTKGIKEIRALGLDLRKDGYTLEDFYETIPNYKTKTRYKFRTLKNLKGELKAIGIEMHFSPKASNYYCIPINNAELLRKYIKEFDSHLSGTREELHAAVSEALTFLASKK